MKTTVCLILGMHYFISYTAMHTRDTSLYQRSINTKTQNEHNRADSVPYYITVDSETVIHRSFMFYGQQVLPYCISVGTPEKVNFSINAFNGSIIKVWQGRFLNANLMWVHKARGIGVAQPVEPEIPLGNEKAVASSLTNWSDSIKAPDTCRFLGYDVDKKNNPVFRYLFNGVEIKDSIVVTGNRLQRHILPSVAGTKELFYKLIDGKTISKTSPTAYLVDGNVTVTAPENENLFIRTAGDRQLLLKKISGQFSYFISWK